MTEPKPPERGKYSDLLRKEWKLELPKSRRRWYRTPKKMAEEDFQLQSFESISAFQSFTWRRIEGGEEKFYYAVRVGFDEAKTSFQSDLKKSDVLVGRNGRAFPAIEKSEIFQPEKRLYLAGLPEEIEMAVIRETLKEYVEFYETTTPVFYLERGHFSGKFMLRIKNFVKVPPRQLYLECDDEELSGMGFTVFATGYTKETPVSQTPRKCFRCEGDHLVKDCKKKMVFSWKCTACGLTSIQCYEGKCALAHIAVDATETVDGLLAKKSTTRASGKVVKAIKKEIDEMRGHLASYSEYFRQIKNTDDLKTANQYGLAVRRYYNRAKKNFLEKSKGDFEWKLFDEEFMGFFRNQLSKIDGKSKMTIDEDDD